MDRNARTAAAGVLALALLGGPVTSRAQSGILLVVNKSESTVSFVDAASRRELARVPTGFAPHEVAVSPDGRWAYVSDYGNGPRPGNTVTILDVEQQQRAGLIDLGGHTRPHGITVAADGGVWVTTEGSRHVLRLDPATRRVTQATMTGQEVTHMVSASR